MPHMSKHCQHRNDRRKSKRSAEPHKISKGHGTRSGRIDAMGHNYGMRETPHGPRLEHFGGNFVRKASDVLVDDATDYASRWQRHDGVGDDCEYIAEGSVAYNMTGYGLADEPRRSLFDEMMACPVKETRRKRRSNGIVNEVAHVTPALAAEVDANDELSDILSHFGTELTDGDIAWAGQDSSEESDSSLEDYYGDSDSTDEYDDCWDAYEEDDREWIDLCEEEEAGLYYSDDDPFAVK